MQLRNRPRFSSRWSLLALAVTASCAGSRPATPPPAPKQPTDARTAVASLAARIRAADYEGNRPELGKLFGEMAPDTQGTFASRAHYWRGFAMWRRALNGFNDNVDKAELAEDLKNGIVEFEAAFLADPQFTDAKVGQASCVANLAFVTSGPAQLEGYRRSGQILRDAQKEAPKNPRLAWVLGASLFNTPPEFGGSQDRAIETFKAGLESARQERVADALDPSWGEAELLMSLGFSNLNRKQPDFEAAERYARAALALVPNWHGVRDILIPQIQAAKSKAAATNPKS
jgi:hypothetical protein